MKKLNRRLLAVGLLAMIMIFVALFSWRYQTLNAPLAHPAVKTRSLSLPAKVVLHRRTVSLEKVEATIVHGQWRVRLHFRQSITKQNMKHMKFQLAQQREGREVPNEPQADLSQDQKVITMMDAYYSRATDNRVVITTLPQALNSQNLVQIVPFESSRK